MPTLVNGDPDGRIPNDDLGLLRGWSVFETLRTYGLRPFRMQRHVQRLQRSAQLMEIPLADQDTIQSEIERVLAEDSWVRILCTGSGTRVVTSKPIDTTRIGRPIRAAGVVMEPSEWMPGVVKHGCRAPWIVASRRHQVDEVFLLDRHRRILEANRSNVIAVRDGVLYTPPLDGRQLEGVTRGAMLDAAQRVGLKVIEAPLAVDASVDELYVCSTLKELAPVAELDGRSCSPAMGEVGLRLHRAFRDLVAAELGKH